MNLDKKKIYKEIKEEYRRFNNGEAHFYYKLQLLHNCRDLLKYCEDLEDHERKKLKQISNDVENHFSRIDKLYKEINEVMTDWAEKTRWDKKKALEWVLGIEEDL